MARRDTRLLLSKHPATSKDNSISAKVDFTSLRGRCQVGSFFKIIERCWHSSSQCQYTISPYHQDPTARAARKDCGRSRPPLLRPRSSRSHCHCQPRPLRQVAAGDFEEGVWGLRTQIEKINLNSIDNRLGICTSARASAVFCNNMFKILMDAIIGRYDNSKRILGS